MKTKAVIHNPIPASKTLLGETIPMHTSRYIIPAETEVEVVATLTQSIVLIRACVDNEYLYAHAYTDEVYPEIIDE